MPSVNATTDSQEQLAIASPAASEKKLLSIAAIVLRVLLGAALSAGVIAAYVLFANKPPVITGEADPVATFFIHRAMAPGLGGPGMVGVHQPFDQVLVLANVRVHNQSKIPVFIHDLWALVTLPDMERRALAAGHTDFNRVFLAYPEMAPLMRTPLLRDVTIEPHSTVEGQMIFNYPLTKDEWDTRRSLDITVSFQHQKDMTIHVAQ